MNPFQFVGFTLIKLYTNLIPGQFSSPATGDNTKELGLWKCHWFEL